jgi:hypothetical protein
VALTNSLLCFILHLYIFDCSEYGIIYVDNNHFERGVIMARTVTQYDLLISCPSDVIEELEIIKETVEEFNRMFGSANNAVILPKHWSVDSYPQSGGKPQDLLNEQFVHDCDLAVAVFWTRFGTPTEKYGSGTEEEIEELIKDGKQVFLYFSNRHISPASLDSEQYNKVKEFRKKYEDQGIYYPYSDLSEFKKMFLNHLSLHFVRLMAGEGESQLTPKSLSNLSIEGVVDGEITKEPRLYKTKYSKTKFKEKIRTEVYELYNQVKEIDLPNNFPVEEESQKSNDIPIDTDLTFLKNISSSIKLQKQFDLLGSPIQITDGTKKVIIAFANEHSISLNKKEFFYIGNLKRQKNFVQLYGNSGYSLNGTEQEKIKYRTILKLYHCIQEYYQWDSYFSNVDSLYCLDLCLSNKGTHFDEDIDVKLYVESGTLCLNEQMPVPGDNILEEATKYIKLFFKHKKSLSVNEYEDNFEVPSYNPVDNLPNLPLYQPSYEDQIKYHKEEYKDRIEEIFCYENFKENGRDIIMYNQSYIKQKTNTFLPSVLLFKSNPVKIHYKISAKHSPELITGELKLK